VDRRAIATAQKIRAAKTAAEAAARRRADRSDEQHRHGLDANNDGTVWQE
jgi:hypothetical protein